jgi:hypothetical protein
LFCSILTGWGKHIKVMGNGTLKKAVEALLDRMGSPFRVADVSTGDLVATWLNQPGIYNLLVLHDVINHSQASGPSHDNPALKNKIDTSYDISDSMCMVSDMCRCSPLTNII